MLKCQDLMMCQVKKHLIRNDNVLTDLEFAPKKQSGSPPLLVDLLGQAKKQLAQLSSKAPARWVDGALEGSKIQISRSWNGRQKDSLHLGSHWCS